MSKVVITYCTSWGYLPRATRAVDALKTNLGVEPEVVKGSGGIFTVAVNGVVVSAKEKGVFPSEDEIVQKVKAALSA